MVQSSSSRKKQDRRFFDEGLEECRTAGNVTNHSVRKTCISGLMDAEVPVNYVAQLSGHKNLKKLRFVQNCFRRPPAQDVLVLSSGTKSPISSNDAPLNQAVKASQHPFKPREDKQASSGEDPFAGFFAGSNISNIEGFTFNFSFNTAPCSIGESSARSKPQKRHIIILDESDSD